MRSTFVMTGLACISSFAFALGGCGLPAPAPAGGGGSCAPICNGDQTTCPAVPSNLTALASLHAGATVATGILGPTSQWMGEFAGGKIMRDGTPSPDPDVVNLLGKQTNVYVSGWVFKFCAGMNDLLFSAGPQVSSIQEGCGDIDCSALPTMAEPKIDTAAAIAAAYPGDPATTLYNVNFMPVLTNNQRLWTVSHRGDAAQIKVDADTGAVVP